MSEDNKIIHETECFFCHKEFGYEGEQYKDVTCPHCHTENSIYNPSEFISEEKENP